MKWMIWPNCRKWCCVVFLVSFHRMIFVVIQISKQYELDFRDRGRAGLRIQSSVKNFQLTLEVLWTITTQNIIISSAKQIGLLIEKPFSNKLWQEILGSSCYAYGKKISSSDGLPHYVCVLCVSLPVLSICPCNMLANLNPWSGEILLECIIYGPWSFGYLEGKHCLICIIYFICVMCLCASICINNMWAMLSKCA